MKAKLNGMDSGWQSCAAAARRLRRNVGHINRLCRQRLVAEGKARWVTGGGKKAHYEVRTDATLKYRHSGPDLTPINVGINGGTPILITIGDVTIIIQHGTAPSVTTPGNGRREAFKRASKLV